MFECYVLNSNIHGKFDTIIPILEFKRVFFFF